MSSANASGGGIYASNQGGLTDPFLLAVTVDPKSPTTVYVGTLNNGIFKSTNGGASWSPSNAGLPSAATITALAIDPLTPLTLYAGLKAETGVDIGWRPVGSLRLASSRERMRLPSTTSQMPISMKPTACGMTRLSYW